MKRIEAIIQPAKIDLIIDRLEDIGITGLNITEVQGYGAQKGHEEMYRGVTYRIRLRTKLKIEVIVEDSIAENVIKTIMENARTGNVGDGKIFISPVDDVYRIRTGENGEEAL